ncbi:MAG: hypothetical protein HOP08_00560 [Cyclobacteriaceae bacterium]|nr:hypothetical protein [Cyclobacteriaceae bacterium]
MYISRHLSVKDISGKDTVYLDNDFFQLEGPLVILGEPGSGKSEVVNQLTNLPSTLFYRASGVVASPSNIISDENVNVIIDGLDEVTAYDEGTPIIQVLSKIKSDKIEKFIFTCRAIDWQNEANSSIIFNRWKKRPIVGVLLPLTNSEIIDFVNKNGNGQDGEEFLESAEKQTAIDLLRNPQMLSMLISVVQQYGWPANRKELYSKTCTILISEPNTFHRSANRTRPPVDLLLKAAGFLCTHLILSNNTTIKVDPAPGSESHSLSDFVTEGYTFEILKEALSSMIFRTLDGNTVEVCHRTVAEYLSALWISVNLSDQLSVRRLETLLYAENYHVTPALRGLHAWIATLATEEFQNVFIPRDPYGILRYGDPSDFPLLQAKCLLLSLQQLADTDPYFRNGDWHSTYAPAFNRIELKTDILDVLKSSKHYHLKHLILESIKGEKVSNEITEDLINIIGDNCAAYIERDAALDVLKETNQPRSWDKITESLHDLGDIDSLRLAIKIIESFPNTFSARSISKVLDALAHTNKRPNRISGLGFMLPKVLSFDQLSELLCILCDLESNNDPDEEKYPHRWIYGFTHELLLRDLVPEPQLLYKAIRRVRHYSDYRREDFNNSLSKYFISNETVRQAIQDVEFSNYSPGRFLIILHDLTQASTGLMLTDNDVIRRLTMLDDINFPNREQQWAQFADFVLAYSNDFENSLALIKNQAGRYPELNVQYEKLLQPKPDPEKDYKAAQKKWAEKRKKEERARHKSYENIADQLNDGTHLEAISHIAKAFLGWFNDIKGDNQRARVQSLVGQKMTDAGLNSISKFVIRTTVPSAKAIIELRTKENKEYFVEPVLIAYYSLKKDFDNEPVERLTSALAVCRWGVHFHGDTITPDLQEKLEAIVFNSDTQKIQFLKDTIEPYIEIGSDHIAGLNRLYEDKLFETVAGKVAMEWLQKYSSFSDFTLNDLLRTAIHHCLPSDVLTMAHTKINAKEWKNDEQRGLWMTVLFLLDFSSSIESVIAFAKTNLNHFWSIKHAIQHFWPKRNLTAHQNHFLIKQFAPTIAPEMNPPSGFVGRDHPWEARQFILDRIAELSTDGSDDALQLMEDLDALQIRGYENDIKHSLVEQKNLRATHFMKKVGWNDVRPVLINSAPLNHSDLQSLLLDQLELLQKRIKYSQTNDYIIFWNGDIPQTENYSRDRIVALLTPYLEKFRVRCYTEGTMPEGQRCDFLNSLNLIDLPVEIKGQWHPDIWTGALSQLETYSKMYRANGYGIYLVLWFGQTKVRSPRKFELKEILSYKEMVSILNKNYSGKISSKTKLFVLDLSSLI